MATYSQLQAQIEKLQKEADLLLKRELAETIIEIKKYIAEFGLTAEDLGLRSLRPGKRSGSPGSGKGRRGQPINSDGRNPVPLARSVGTKSTRKAPSAADRRSVVAPKYRDRLTGATWTGRGKQPKWLTQALMTGKSLIDFKI